MKVILIFFLVNLTGLSLAQQDDLIWHFSNRLEPKPILKNNFVRCDKTVSDFRDSVWDEPLLVEQIYFDELGRSVAIWKYKNEEPNEVRYYTYDAKGRISSNERRELTWNYHVLDSMVYNEKNLLDSVLSFSVKWVDVSNWEIDTVEIYEQALELYRSEWFMYDQNQLVSRSNGRESYNYIQLGDTIKESFVEQGRVMSIWVKGKLIETFSTESTEPSTQYCYNSDGQLIKMYNLGYSKDTLWLRNYFYEDDLLIKEEEFGFWYQANYRRVTNYTYFTEE